MPALLQLNHRLKLCQILPAKFGRVAVDTAKQILSDPCPFVGSLRAFRSISMVDLYEYRYSSRHPASKGAPSHQPACLQSCRSPSMTTDLWSPLIHGELVFRKKARP